MSVLSLSTLMDSIQFLGIRAESSYEDSSSQCGHQHYDDLCEEQSARQRAASRHPQQANRYSLKLKESELSLGIKKNRTSEMLLFNYFKDPNEAAIRD